MLANRDPLVMHTGAARKSIAYYLRDCGNLHYFAAIKPYLDHFIRRGENHIVVLESSGDHEQIPEYVGYRHLFTSNHELDDYDLVLTPTHICDHEIESRAHVVQIFHGISDKPFTYEREFNDYRLCLCAGQRQVDRLRRNERNRDMRFATVGYPKFDRIPSAPVLFDNGRKTVIYCPTWRKGGLSSIEIFLNHPDVIAGLCEDYNLIVKPHPNIFNPAREFFDANIVERLESTRGIALIRSGNVMPWFAQADVFIGDVSASGYEWLCFGRPMVFLNPQPGVLAASADPDSATYLWQCGEVCDDVRELKRLVDKAMQEDELRDAREQLLHYSVYRPRDGCATARGVAEIEALLFSGAVAAECLQ
ncbi:MAG: CDP-glycerol glycerophosphotransferase family protein [Burkholderiales bacterium]